MKKFIIIFCIILLFANTAIAKVYKKIDNFDDSIMITSEKSEYVKSKDSILNEEFTFQFVKFFSNDNESPAIGLKIYKYSDNWWFFNDMPFEFKIENTVYKTSKVITNSNMINSNYNNLHTDAWAIFDEILLDKIVNANEITIRYYFSNKQPITFKIPKKMLNEWKEVINSNKDWKKKKNK